MCGTQGKDGNEGNVYAVQENWDVPQMFTISLYMCVVTINAYSILFYSISFYSILPLEPFVSSALTPFLCLFLPEILQVSLDLMSQLA